MALGDPYITLAELRAYMGITVDGDDAELEDAIASVSREIERHCGRQFNRADTASQRLFVPTAPTWAYVDDIHSTTGLVVEVDETGSGSWSTWDADAYQVEPLNGTVEGQDGWPYYKITALDGCFPRCGRRATLRVTAQWGWESVPAPVKQAAKILAAETVTLRTAPLGVAGVDDYGVVRVRDSRMAAGKLAKYVKHRILVG